MGIQRRGEPDRTWFQSDGTLVRDATLFSIQWHISAGNNDNTYHLKAKNFDAGTWLGVANDAQGESLIVNKAPVEWTIIMVDPNNHQSPYLYVYPASRSVINN